ncbi:polyprenyl diphosphate synthase [Sansalvadorimonas sp. 2012CJ34-2]|uniref:Ditrans,polycis-undecaprenyl-diphosphate synthase ((2E,6E)-farnesyl-diphosphate specific) n=1 Tax=Parendozoicomonas callyspongiae TaxID=2942213 RepID=A0ABT0PGM2_9GAMM|nr:polyprenyl diphosphate synthase [Sansalvadorimonas sp. 2012CJ34-2]MCL6270510.1 polyprenyl diphosphate synthase [Sansalvadorimonas sp. 2012CJ34-2]
MSSRSQPQSNLRMQIACMLILHALISTCLADSLSNDGYQVRIGQVLSGIAQSVSTAAQYPSMALPLSRFKNHLQTEYDEFSIPKQLISVPGHVALILDGDRRWSDEQNYQDRAYGYLFGALRLGQIMALAQKSGISQLTLYLFSTENFRRPEHEVRVLMSLLEQSFQQFQDQLVDSNMRFRHLGRRQGLPKSLLDTLDVLTATTANNTGMRVNLAINYGGTAEIEDAAKAILKSYVDGTLPDQFRFNDYLYSSSLDGWSNPDLVIRAGREKRISNFLPLQSIYSEWVFRNELWPAFTPDVFIESLQEFNKRERRLGR